MRERLEALWADRRSATAAGAIVFAVLVAVFVAVSVLTVDDGDDGGAPGPPGSPTTARGADDPSLPPRDDGPLSSARAIQAAVDRAEPGDDLVIASGTYELSLEVDRVSGTADEPIRLRAEPGGEVTVVAGDRPYALYVHNAAHWEIGSDDAQLTFDGDERARATVGLGLYSGSIAKTSNDDPGPAKSITLRNIDMVRSGQGLLRIGANSTDIEVLDSRLAGSGRRRAEYGEGIYLGSAEGEDRVSDIRIRGVRISDVRAEAIDIKSGADDIRVEDVEITDVVLRSDDTNNKCAIAHRSDGALAIVDTVISGVRSGEDVAMARNEPCGIYVDGPISIERTTITDTEREAVWVNNADAGIEVRIVDIELNGNGGRPSGISHSGERVEWTVRTVGGDHLSPSIAGPSVELEPEAAREVTSTTST